MTNKLPHSNIKSWSAEDRPREKLLLKGKDILSNAELIAILIASGNKHETAVELSRKILNSVNNNLNMLGKLTVIDLMKFNGIGEAKAISIIAALELGRRRKESDSIKNESIKTSNDVYNVIQSVLADKSHEEFWVLLLNKANKIIGKHQISLGGSSGTIADTI